MILSPYMRLSTEDGMPENVKTMHRVPCKIDYRAT